MIIFLSGMFVGGVLASSFFLSWPVLEGACLSDTVCGGVILASSGFGGRKLMTNDVFLFIIGDYLNILSG